MIITTSLMWLLITCTSDKTKGPQEVAKTKEGRPGLNLTIQAERRSEEVGGGSFSRLSYLASSLWVDMLVILCTEQVKEVRGFKHSYHFAPLGFTVPFSKMFFLVMETEKCLDLDLTGVFFNNLLKLIATASLSSVVTLIHVISGKAGHVFSRHVFRRQDLTI